MASRSNSLQGCRSYPYGPACEHETEELPLSCDLRNMRQLIKGRTLGRASSKPPSRYAEQVTAFQKFLKTWIVIGIDLLVERTDGEQIESEVQYDLGYLHIDHPDPGDRIDVRERRGSLEVSVTGHVRLDWTVLWRDWEDMCPSYKRTIYGRDMFKNGMVITKEIWKWQHNCSCISCSTCISCVAAHSDGMGHGCGLVTEFNMVGKQQSLAIKDELLIWTWSEVNSCRDLISQGYKGYGGDVMEYNYGKEEVLTDVRTTWIAKARPILDLF